MARRRIGADLDGASIGPAEAVSQLSQRLPTDDSMPAAGSGSPPRVMNRVPRGEPLGAAEVLIPLAACGAPTLACLASVTWMLKRAKLLG